MLNLFQNRTFILALAFILGLIFSDAASFTGMLTIPALALVFTVSTTQFSIREFFPLSKMIRPFVLCFAFNYLLLGTLILLLAWWLMPTRDLWIGFVLVAAAPPGIAIIPFTYILKGDINLSLLGTFGVYVFSVAFTPALIFLFTGDAVPPLKLVVTLFQLIIIPLILSQLIRGSRIAPYVDRWRGTIVNWGFFIVLFSVVGLNQEVFLREPQLLMRVSAVALASTFGLVFLIDFLGKRYSIPEPTKNSFILLSTIKTSGFSAAVAIALFNEITSLPAAVISGFYALHFIFLGMRADRMKKPNPDLTVNDKVNNIENPE